jgi:acyl-CoA reductase-like NAD-dependent aldehyde dehydrogenase
MSTASETGMPMRHPDRFYIGGQWASPSTDATFDVIEAATEQTYFRVAEARDADMQAAVGAAREAFDHGPWPRLSHAERAGYLRAIAEGLARRMEDLAQAFPRETGVLYKLAPAYLASTSFAFNLYADMAVASRSRSRPRPPTAATSACWCASRAQRTAASARFRVRAGTCNVQTRKFGR